jgi:hypothetical protein
MIYQQLLYRIAKSMLGNGVMELIMAADGKVSLKKYREFRRRLKKLNKEFRKNKIHLKNLYWSCTEHMRPVTSPLVLISQIQRSGGSLLSQLFDGHPELDAHPHELKIGYPTKYIWPKLDLNDDPGRWFETLFETMVLKHFRKGYSKQKNPKETFLFLFLASVQRQLFLNYLDSVDSITLPEFSQRVAAPPEIIAAHEFWKDKNIEQETIQKNDADKWRKALSPGQADIVSCVTRPYAEKLGYNLNYNLFRVGCNFLCDIPKLTSKGELKKLFSKIHG